MVLDIAPESVEGLKVAELKEALTAVGLSTKGVKKELAARLLEHLQQATTPVAPTIPAAAAAAAAPAAPTEATAVFDAVPDTVLEPEPTGQSVGDDTIHGSTAGQAEPVPEPVPEPAPEAVPEPASEAVPEPAPPEAVPEPAPPEAVPEPASEAKAEARVDSVVAPVTSTEESTDFPPPPPPAAASASIEAGEVNPPPAATGLQALRAEVGSLQKQHHELSGLVSQWYASVVQLQQQQQQQQQHAAAAAAAAAAASAARQHPGGQHYAGYPGYPAAAGAYPGYPGYPPAQQPAAPAGAWSEHYTPEGYKYWYNATTGASSWEQPPGAGGRRHVSGGGGGAGAGIGTGTKTKGPPGANLFVVRKMRRGEYDEFFDEDLRRGFERFGTVLRAEVTLDKDTGVSKGYGFVSFSAAHEADAAMREMNGAVLAGRQLRIEKTTEG